LIPNRRHKYIQSSEAGSSVNALSAKIGDRDPQTPGLREKPHEGRIKRSGGNGGEPVRSPQGRLLIAPPPDGFIGKPLDEKERCAPAKKQLQVVFVGVLLRFRSWLNKV
jgi:hypothetical protein